MVRHAAPLLVWMGAIAAALALYVRAGTPGQITGYAQEELVTLSHLEPGIVRDVHVTLYDRVTPGQLLVSMRDDVERSQFATVQTQIEQLRAEVSARQVRLDLENTLVSADLDDLRRRAEVDRDTAHIEYLSQLMVNARDRILLRGARVEYDIVRGLHQVDNAAFRELNDLETQVESLATSLRENETVLERKKTAFEEADRRWHVAREHRAMPLPSGTVLAPHRLAITARQHELEGIIARIDAHVLRTPRPGQVVMLAAQPGARVQTGTPLVQISGFEAQRIVAYLPERQIHSVQPGSNVAIERLAGGARRQRLEGTVVDLSAAIIEAPARFRRLPNYPVWGRGVLIALRDANASLVPGEAVSVRFIR